MLVLFTLSLGMLIGAQVAGWLEARHTPVASTEYAARVVATGRFIDQLADSLESADTADKIAIEGQIRNLQGKQDKLRQAELQAIEWRPLWSKPAIFAAVILVLFVALFRENPRQQQASLELESRSPRCTDS